MKISSLALVSAIAAAFVPSFVMGDCGCTCTNPFTFLNLCNNCLSLQCETETIPDTSPPNDHCWAPKQITCPSFEELQTLPPNMQFHRYQDSTVKATDESNELDKCFGHIPSGTNQRGVWYKFSVGADPLLLKLDACEGQASNWNARVTIYEGTCAEGTADPGSELDCYPAIYLTDTCLLEAAFTGSVPDKDYLILVEGKDNWFWQPEQVGTFNLDVSCYDVPGPFLNPLGTVDRWFIQRSSAPAPDITMFDPIEGAHWLELNEWQVVSNAVPRLNATAYQTPTNGRPCDEGTPLSGTFSYTNSTCTGNGCPETQNNGVMVKQEFTIDDPYTVVPNIYTPPSNSSIYGKFSFCIHSELMFDYLEDDDIPDTVSYFDTYYNVLIDYEADMIVCVAALERNPGQVDDLFDGFRVEAYTCHDGDPLSAEKNTPVLPYYHVGETYRICIKPTVEFEDTYDVVEFSGDITCNNTAGERVVIEDGQVVYSELSFIDDSGSDKPPGETSILAFNDTITDNFLPPNSGGQATFKCEGPVKIAPKAIARRLQEGESIPDAELLTGTFNIQLTITPPEGKLSTGAIVGISIAGFAVFLVLLLIMYRRGCFDKRNNNQNKPPKTVNIEESSETSGEEAA